MKESEEGNKGQKQIGVGPYTFVMESASTGGSICFEIDEIDPSPTNFEVFSILLEEAFFKRLIPGFNTNEQLNTAFNSMGLEDNKLTNPLNTVQFDKVKYVFDRMNIDTHLDTVGLKKKINSIAADLTDATGKGNIEKLQNDLIAKYQINQDQLRVNLGRLARELLSDAALKTPSGSRSDNSNLGESLTPDLKIAPELKEVFELKKAYLHRKSMKIGRQIYSLGVKEIEPSGGGSITYVFEFRLGADTVLFGMETVESNATSAEVLAGKLRQGLDQFLFKSQTKENKTSWSSVRKQQLPKSHIQRIREIAQRLEKNPNDFNVQDRDFIKNSIKQAADQYGFDAQELRETLENTGIVNAMRKRRIKAAVESTNSSASLIDTWISEATIIYTNFFEDLDRELLRIATNFLFDAYKNTIRVTQDSLAIGHITAAKTVPIYQRDLTYGKMGLKDRPDADESDFFPIGEIDVDKVKIEFENETIQNIEIQGTKKDKADLFNTIIPSQKFIYVKVLDQMIPIPTNINEYDQKVGNVRDTINQAVQNNKKKGSEANNNKVKSDEVTAKFLSVKDVIWKDEGGIELGRIELKIINPESNFDDSSEAIPTKKENNSRRKLEKLLEKEKDGTGPPTTGNNKENDGTSLSKRGLKIEKLKAKDVKQKGKEKSISFDFYLILWLPMPAEDDEFDRFINDDLKPILNFDVEIFADENGTKLLNAYKVKPYVMINFLDTKEINENGITEIKLTASEADRLDYSYAAEELLLPYHPNLSIDYEDDEDDYSKYDYKSGTLKFDAPLTQKFKSTTREKKNNDYLAKGKELIFQNQYPISYSTKSDVTNYRAAGRKKRLRTLYEHDNEHFILLDDVIKNDVEFYNKTENYSPRNSVIIIDDLTKEVPIYKEFVRELLKAKIFSDFVGFDETNPNGLVQTEVSKRLFLNTNANPAFKNFMYHGYANFIEPKLVISKIEEQNKFLPLKSATFERLVDGEMTPFDVGYVSSVDILNYSNLQVGGEIGLAYYGFPKFHMRLDFGIGAFIHQTGLSDTTMTRDPLSNNLILTENEFNVNSLVYYPEVRLQFNPDPRIGLQFAYRPTWVNLLSRDIEQVDNEENFFMSNGLINDRKFTHLLQLFAFIEVNKDGNGEFFFRTNFSMSSDDRATNFLQVQLGYAFNIFTTDKSKKEQKVVTGKSITPKSSN